LAGVFHLIKLVKLESYQGVWKHINIPDAIAIYAIPNYLPYPFGIASIFEALLGKPRFIEYKIERHYRKSYWDMAASGGWALVPVPRKPMAISVIDESGYTFPSDGIVVFWSHKELSMARLIIEEV